MSHDKGEERRRGIGFWGVMEKCRPIDGVDPTLDGWIQRASKKSANIPIRQIQELPQGIIMRKGTPGLGDFPKLPA
jgi:hypothetical protein